MIQVTSTAFRDGSVIPERFTCRGAGDVPDLAWSGVPAEAPALAVVVDDPDAPRGTFVHAVWFDLPASTASWPEGGPGGTAKAARNSGGRTGWYPPCPPSGTHHYRFTVVALREPLGLDDGADHASVIDAINNQAVAKGTLVGLVRG